MDCNKDIDRALQLIRALHETDREQSQEKANALFASEMYRAQLEMGGIARQEAMNALFPEGWLIKLFIKSQPADSLHARWWLVHHLEYDPLKIQFLEYMMQCGVSPDFNSDFIRGEASPLWAACEATPDCSGELYSEEERRASLECLEVVNLLIKYGADTNRPLLTDAGWGATEYYVAGSTPLHEAAVFDRRNVARVLLQAGANRHALDRKGRRPYDIAQFEWPDSEIANMMK